jgi:hypothetical protein
MQSEVHGHVVHEADGSLARVVEMGKVREQIAVQVTDAVQLEGLRFALEGQAPQDDGGQVAPVERRSGARGERGAEVGEEGFIHHEVRPGEAANMPTTRALAARA